jgi:hypothetical protein
MPGDSKKPRKRDILFSLFKRRQPPTGKETSLQPSAADKSPSGTASAVAAEAPSSNETTIASTRAFTTSRQRLITTPLATGSSLESQPSGTVRDETLRSEPAIQSEPRAATATAEGGAPSEIGNERAQPTSSATSAIKTQSLWNRAINSSELLPLRETLTEIGIEADTLKTTSALETLTKRILNDKDGNSWKILFRGEEIVLKHIGMKVLQWVQRFKEVGDIIVQFDPGHAALPWAGFRFLLQLCLDKQETVDAILVGLEKTAGLIDRCTVYELLYLNGDSAPSKTLEKSILRLYTAILKYLAEAIKRSKGMQPRQRT